MTRDDMTSHNNDTTGNHMTRNDITYNESDDNGLRALCESWRHIDDDVCTCSIASRVDACIPCARARAHDASGSYACDECNTRESSCEHHTYNAHDDIDDACDMLTYDAGARRCIMTRAHIAATRVRDDIVRTDFDDDMSIKRHVTRDGRNIDACVNMSHIIDAYINDTTRGA